MIFGAMRGYVGRNRSSDLGSRLRCLMACRNEAEKMEANIGSRVPGMQMQEI